MSFELCHRAMACIIGARRKLNVLDRYSCRDYYRLAWRAVGTLEYCKISISITSDDKHLGAVDIATVSDVMHVRIHASNFD